MLIKSFLLLILFAGLSIGLISTDKNYSPVAEKSLGVKTAHLNFDKDVKPIFEQHCNPCHFPGGKMYERLPFDKSATILGHEEGILRRIKDSVEVGTIKEFVAENQKAESVKQ